MIVILSAEAEKDLEAIGQYIANDSPRRAVTFIDELLTRCLAIANLHSRTRLFRGMSTRGYADVCTATT